MLQNMRRYIVLLLFTSYLQFCLGQSKRLNDFAVWANFQIQKNTFKNQYFAFQYRGRFDHNASAFDQSNFYFIYGFNWAKNWNSEVLYQFTTSKTQDRHKFYLSLSYKVKLIKNLYLELRTAAQHKQNFFSGDKTADKPITDWRNRLKLSYTFQNNYVFSVSAEPYLTFTGSHPVYFSKMRAVAQFSLKYNKYNTLSLYYLAMPDLVSFSHPKTDHILGITYSIKLPDKRKEYKKFFKPKFFKPSKKGGKDSDF